ncbi:multicopper oxidase family protein [Planobispora longispora]|uniref:multicopper oxidase family protein n=1 Tax=Planobispora longispora TaxID=28887 RepID=UPI003622F155
MTTAQLLALDHIVLALVAALWLGAGAATVMSRRDRRTRLIALAGVLAALTASYPVSPVTAAFLVALVATATVITHHRLSSPAGPSSAEARPNRIRARRRGHRSTTAGVAVLCSAVVWAGLSAWSSRVPDRLNLGAHHSGSGARPVADAKPVTDLRGPVTGAKIRRFTLTARPATITLGSGKQVEAWTFDGRAPGPTLRVRQGELVEVRLRNAMPDLGVTLHWHGYDVPVGEDGVAGVTQDAVRPGGEFVYRFPAEDAGSYWYHSHDLSDPAVRMGLYGMLVVGPAPAPEEDSAKSESPQQSPASESSAAEPPAGVSDHTVSVHVLGGVPTAAVDDRPPPTAWPRSASPRTPVRLRVTGTDNAPRILGVSGAPYRIAAVDGRDLPAAREVTGERVRLAAGGRHDLTFTMPATPVLLSADDRADLGVLVTPGSGAAPPPASGPLLDVTAYGTGGTPDPGPFDREITWVLDRGPAVLDGVPTLAHTVNGAVWPNIPAPVVREGELVKITVANRGRDTHPMHPHGHHVLVLSRNGVPAGGPVWTDTFDVGPGEVWEVALRADNPGIWMSHCHDLGHAALGMTFHLAYEGVTTPYDAGHASGNHPE